VADAVVPRAHLIVQSNRDVEEFGHVARGIHIGHIRLEVFVGDDAAAHRDRRVLQKVDVHRDAQADAEQVARQLLTLVRSHAAHLAIAGVHLLDFGAVVNIDTRLARDVVDECPSVFVEDPAQEARTANEPRHR